MCQSINIKTAKIDDDVKEKFEGNVVICTTHCVESMVGMKFQTN